LMLAHTKTNKRILYRPSWLHTGGLAPGSERLNYIARLEQPRLNKSPHVSTQSKLANAVEPLRSSTGFASFDRVCSSGELVDRDVLGVRVNPHRERQTIPQDQTFKPAQILSHANGQSAPVKAALATFAGARGATHRARPRSPSRPALTALAQHITHSHSGHDEKRPTVKFVAVKPQLN